MTDILIIIFLFISIGFVVTIELMIKKGKLKRVDTYSYKTVIKTTMRLFYTAIIISLVVYFFFKIGRSYNNFRCFVAFRCNWGLPLWIFVGVSN